MKFTGSEEERERGGDQSEAFPLIIIIISSPSSHLGKTN